MALPPAPPQRDLTVYGVSPSEAFQGYPTTRRNLSQRLGRF
ncbi:hypothetical protein [Phormidium sp. FACHB-1136]|nr:hypothetical protein [Phormidium sp. FACHB-1136]